MHRLGNKEEREKRIKWWYQLRREAWKKMGEEMDRQRKEMDLHRIKFLRLFGMAEEITEERYDVYIYKILRYARKSTPPTSD